MWDCRTTPQVGLRPDQDQVLQVQLTVSWCGSLALCRAGEACWWTIHPASKQRSEGEKVRVGDDLILVSVSSERYLVRGLSGGGGSSEVLNVTAVCLQHLSYGNGSLHVDAAFQQTLWSVAPICSGSEVAQGTCLMPLWCHSDAPLVPL